MTLDAIRQKTILVVDDDELVLNVVASMLERSDYNVIRAVGPAEAVRLEAAYEGVIDLLLSDVVMPVMSGSQLASQIQQHRPEMRVMFMSGYPDGALLLLNYGWTFLKKPFVKEALVERVHETLHSGVRSQGTDHFDTRK